MSMERDALELRYDGPIPAQHLDSDKAALRRKRGTLSVLESQAQQFLDSAERLQGNAEDLTSELAENNLMGWRRDTAERQLKMSAERSQGHIEYAAEAFLQAVTLRETLGLPPHPILALLSAIYGKLDAEMDGRIEARHQRSLAAE